MTHDGGGIGENWIEMWWQRSKELLYGEVMD